MGESGRRRLGGALVIAPQTEQQRNRKQRQQTHTHRRTARDPSVTRVGIECDVRDTGAKPFRSRPPLPLPSMNLRVIVTTR